MCGIAGIYAYLDVAPPVDRAELARMNDRMAPRGPDGSGDWLSADGRVGFTHRRLAIIDLSERGAQPMHSADGALTITFNGEIYNYRELRGRARSQGPHASAPTPTPRCCCSSMPTAARRWSRRCAACSPSASGIRGKRRLLLARDPLGIKPLYYADDGWTLRFASQAKALLAGGAVSRDPDPAGIVGFHLLGSVPEPFTVWRGIRALPAGATMIVDAAGPARAAPLLQRRPVARPARGRQ